MTTLPPDKNNEELCFVTVVFPLTDDNQIVHIKQKICEAVKALNQVKIELRVTSVKNNNANNP